MWTRVIGTVIANAYLEPEVYAGLHRQIRQLQELQVKHAVEIRIEDDLLEEYLSALLKSQHYLDQATTGPLVHLKHDFVRSSPM